MNRAVNISSVKAKATVSVQRQEMLVTEHSDAKEGVQPARAWILTNLWRNMPRK